MCTPMTSPRERSSATAAVEHRLLDVGDHDAGALLQQGLDDAPPDATGPAGDDRHRPLQVRQVAHAELPSPGGR